MSYVPKKAVSSAVVGHRSRRWSRAIRALIGAFVARRSRRRRATAVPLHRLSEHLKRDIGISP